MHHELDMPIGESEARALRIGDTVTLNRTLFGIRDATYIHLFDRGRKTRLDLKGHAVIHTAPNVKKVPVSAEHPAGSRSACVTHSEITSIASSPSLSQLHAC